MNGKILSFIIILVTVMFLTSVIVYVIFDNNSTDRRIGNEVTITVEIMIGLFIAFIIQYNQNQKMINNENELHRKNIFSILYGLILFIPIPTLSILKDWKNIQTLPSDKRNKKIMDAVLESNKSYFDLERQPASHTALINPTNRAIFNTTKTMYNSCFSKIQNDPNNKEEIKKLIKYYETCLILIPNKYQDETIERELIKFLDEVNDIKDN